MINLCIKRSLRNVIVMNNIALCNMTPDYGCLGTKLETEKLGKQERENYFVRKKFKEVENILVKNSPIYV